MQIRVSCAGIESYKELLPFQKRHNKLEIVKKKMNFIKTNDPV